MVIAWWCIGGLYFRRLFRPYRCCHLPDIHHPVQDLLDGRAQILPKVEAVSHLNGVGRTLGCGNDSYSIGPQNIMCCARLAAVGHNLVKLVRGDPL
jgi:hypothetical protein